MPRKRTVKPRPKPRPKPKPKPKPRGPRGGAKTRRHQGKTTPKAGNRATLMEYGKSKHKKQPATKKGRTVKPRPKPRPKPKPRPRPKPKPKPKPRGPRGGAKTRRHQGKTYNSYRHMMAKRGRQR